MVHHFLSNQRNVDEDGHGTVEGFGLFQKQGKGGKTPRKARQKPPTWFELRNLSALLESFETTSLRSGHQPGSVEFRLDVIEGQIRTLGEKIVAWMEEESEDKDRVEENINHIHSRLVEMEAMVGTPTEDMSASIDPTIWETIGSLLQRDIQEDIKTTPLRNEIKDQWDKLTRASFDERRANSEFQELLTKWK